MKPLQIGDKLAKLPADPGRHGCGVSLSRLAGAVARTAASASYPLPRWISGSRFPERYKSCQSACYGGRTKKSPRTLLQMQTANARDLSDIISWLPRRIMRIT